MPLPRQPLAVVFDMDGLLFDTETLARAAFFSAAESSGHAVTETICLGMIGSPWPTSRAFLLDQLGPGFPVDAFRRDWKAQYAALLDTELRLKAGVVEILDALDQWGVPRAIATSSGHDAVAHHLATHNLVGRFHAIVAHGDYAAGKPAPDPFLTAARRLDVDPTLCVALEDSHIGVRAACAAGMMTIMVPDLLSPTDEIRALCSHVLADLHAVRLLLSDALPSGQDML